VCSTSMSPRRPSDKSSLTVAVHHPRAASASPVRFPFISVTANHSSSTADNSQSAAHKLTNPPTTTNHSSSTADNSQSATHKLTNPPTIHSSLTEYVVKPVLITISIVSYLNFISALSLGFTVLFYHLLVVVTTYDYMILFLCLQCFGTVDWTVRRASGP